MTDDNEFELTLDRVDRYLKSFAVAATNAEFVEHLTASLEKPALSSLTAMTFDQFLERFDDWLQESERDDQIEEDGL